jgi:glycosyltransferase involved in cell wall biosynthesis
VRRLRLGDRIRLVPVTDELYSWYERADALVSASDIESLPRSVLEAMAFDVPIVAADVYGLSEVITDGLDGILVPARDLDGLVDGLRRFLALDSRRRAALGRAGGRRVRSMFSIDHVALWEGVLRALVDEPAMTLAAAVEQHGGRARGAG